MERMKVKKPDLRKMVRGDHNLNSILKKIKEYERLCGRWFKEIENTAESGILTT